MPIGSKERDDDDDDDSSDNQNKYYDVIIIGSGPSGYTASIYASRAKLKTLIITGSLPGGQLMTTSEVENYPGFPNGIFGPELMINMKQQSERFGTTMIIDEVKRVNFKTRPFKIYTESAVYVAKSVLISTGQHHESLVLSLNKHFRVEVFHIVPLVMDLSLKTNI